MIRESPLRVEYGAHLSRLRILSIAVIITVLTACNNATSPLHENETHSRVVRSVTVPVTWYDARDSEQIDKLLQSAPHHADMILEYIASLDLDEMPHLEQQQITVCNLTAALQENWWTGNNYARGELDCWYTFSNATLRPEILNQDTLEGRAFAKPCLAPSSRCNANTAGIPRRSGSGETHCAYADVTVFIGESIGNAATDPECKTY